MNEEFIWTIIIIIVLPILAPMPLIVKCVRRFVKDLGYLRKRQFYPNIYINSFEAKELMNNGLINNKDIASLLLYLANNGYIKILKEPGNVDGKSRYKIIEAKRYTELEGVESQFLRCLFHKNMIIPFLKRKVYVDEIDEEFCQRVHEKINNTPRKKSFLKQQILRIIFFIFYLIIAFACLKYPSVSLLLSLISFMVYAFPLVRSKGAAATYLLGLGCYGSFLLLGFGLTYGAYHTAEQELRLTVFSTIFAIITFIIDKVLWMTTLSTHILNENKIRMNLNNFLDFIKNASKEELMQLSIKDKTYFYKILPYAYAFDLFDELADKLEGTELIAPYWYLSGNIIEFKDFISSMNYLLSSLEQR